MSLDDLGAPLSDCTFAVVDLETTGGSPERDTITEIGAVKVRGGEVLGTFATLVNPGRAIPPTITVLTGITESMVAKAPRIESVLPALLEFLGPDDDPATAIVGHNVRFDLSFLRRALERDGRPMICRTSLDTAMLARRLLAGETPNHKLGTLADCLRLPHRPSHRALDDALSTADLLHVLLERAAAYGVTGLDDLSSLPSMARHPQAAKLRLTQRLPNRPGIYLFRDERGRVLYVGKATNLRARVRSYFSSDERRKVTPLLREATRIDHKECSTTLEASVLEARLIRELTPQYNSVGTRWRKACYVKLTVAERFPRLSVVREARGADGLLMGPIGSSRVARQVTEAIESAIPLRRCTSRITATPTRSGTCAAAQLGVATCPCTGEVSEVDYQRHVDAVVHGVRNQPDVLTGPLESHMHRLAAQERFEEADLTRQRLAALTATIRRQRRLEQLVQCSRLVLRLPAGQRVELRRGVLSRVWEVPEGDTTGPTPTPLWKEPEGRTVEMTPPSLPDPEHPVDKGLADELVAVASWLDRHADSLVLEVAEGTFASALPALGTFTPTRRAAA